MMGSTHDSALARAFQLIEEDRLVEAREIIQSVLVDDNKNPDAWWIYAHAVEDPNEARRALNQVADLDPNYPGLTELLEFYVEAEDDNLIDSTSFDDFEDFDDDFDTQDEESDRSPWLRRLVILAVILLLVVIGVIIVSGGLSGTTPDATATEVAQQPTQEPIVFLPPDNDEAVEITAEPQVAASLAAIFPEYELANNDLEDVLTELGITQVVSLCGMPDPTFLRDGIQSGLVRLSQNIDIISLEAEAIGVRISDCETNETYSFIGTLLDNAASFADGELTQTEYSGTWTTLD